VRLDANDYSVHPGVIGRRVDVVADLQTVTVTCAGRVVASHPRCWAAHQTITDPEHDRSHPIRSASTVAGIVGVSASSSRICGSTASTTDPDRRRSYRGGLSRRNAAFTVLFEHPNRRAITFHASLTAPTDARQHEVRPNDCR
jgi:hypothetical protein